MTINLDLENKMEQRLQFALKRKFVGFVPLATLKSARLIMEHVSDQEDFINAYNSIKTFTVDHINAEGRCFNKLNNTDKNANTDRNEFLELLVDNAIYNI